mgnify:CR=1 FL=1
MEQLTKAEEPVMSILWKLKKAFVKDILNELPEPKPPYNTVSSIVRVLENKGYVGHTAYGKTHQYHPVICKSDYRKSLFKNIMQDYFDGSYKKVVTHLVDEENLSEQEIQEIEAIIENAKKKKP